MNEDKVILVIEKYLSKLRTKENNIEDYHNRYLRDLTNKSKIQYLISICKLFETDEQRLRPRRIKEKNPQPIKNTDINKLTKKDIYDYLKSKWFNKLSYNTKNQHIVRIKRYLKFSKREDLIEAFGEKPFKGKKKTLSNLDLISREDLKIILEHCNLKLRTLLIVLYEGALRKNEALNIRYKYVEFFKGYALIHVDKSKTIDRDIPFVESIPYLKEYFNNNKFEPEDKIFFYKDSSSLNKSLYNIGKVLEKKYPDRWRGRRLYPHLFRHSRLTELATILKESELRLIAGWTAGSSMTEVYVHLDGQSVINKLTKGKVEIKEPEKFEPITCQICNTENEPQNIICYNCNNVLDESKKVEVGVNLINNSIEFDNLKKEMSEMKENLKDMIKIVKLQEGYIFHLAKKDLMNNPKFKDKREVLDNLELNDLEQDSNITNVLIQLYNKQFEK